MPLKGGQVRGALRMLALSPARSAQVVPARPPSSQEKGGIQREQKTHTRYLYTVFDGTITIYWGGRCVLRHHSSRPPTHTLTSLSRTDPLAAAHAATNRLAFALRRVQVLVGVEYPPGEGSSLSCAAGVRAGCSR